ncbi:MAG: hypothetical protein CMJ72_07930 [Planctomycetaceae bacterium]|nr:hypothetical protein [Planctomycetaceae bacterium]
MSPIKGANARFIPTLQANRYQTNEIITSVKTGKEGNLRRYRNTLRVTVFIVIFPILTVIPVFQSTPGR